jgi:peptidoglycan/xylan/chitin deacetylase (PgdA/CDA1 family)
LAIVLIANLLSKNSSELHLPTHQSVSNNNNDPTKPDSQNHNNPLNSSNKINIDKVADKGIIKLPVLMYHHINTLDGVDPKNTIEIGLRVSPDIFEKQLEYVLSKGYTTITADQLNNAIQNNGQLPEKPILITFDDGYKDALTYADPILKKHNAVGDFEIITGAVGKDGYLSWDDVKTLKADGMGISSHTVNHCYLAVNVDPKTATAGPFADSPVNDTPNQLCPKFDSGGKLNTGQVRGELQQSKLTLEKELGGKISTIFYPYGKYNQQTMDIAKSLGYTLGFTVAPQTKSELDLNHLLELPRIRMNGQQSGDITALKHDLYN